MKALFILLLTIMSQWTLAQMDPRIDHYFDRAKKLNDSNPDSALVYYNQIQSLLPENVDSQLLLRYYFRRGFLLHTGIQKFEEAISLSEKTVELIGQRTSQDSISRIYTSLAEAQHKNQDFQSALISLNKAEEARQKGKNPYLMWEIHYIRAMIYAFLEDGPRSMEFFEKSLDILRGKSRRMDHGFVLFNAFENARILEMDQNYADYIEEYLQFAMAKKKKSDDIPGHVMNLMVDPAKENETIKKLVKYLPYHEASNNTSALSVSHLRIAQHYKENKKINKSIEHLMKGLPSARKSILVNYIAYVNELVDCHERIGDYSTALEFSKLKTTLRDSLKNLKTLEQVNELAIEYETKEKEQEIALLNSENQVQSLQINQQRSLLIIGVLGLLLVSAFLFYIFRLNKKLRISNESISKALSEKNILLREIHHRVKNNLQVISSLLSLQSRQIKDKDIQQAIDEGRSRVSSMALIHQNLYQRDNLTGVSVGKYLETLIQELFDTYNIEEDRISLSMDIQAMDLDVDTMVPLGLIINELVSNALKHGFPNNSKGMISVGLHESEGQLFLEVADTGIGIDESKFRASKSFGNRLISAFSKKLKGELNISNDGGAKMSMIINNYKKAA